MTDIQNYRHIMPEESKLSVDEIALRDHIVTLHQKHERHIGKMATIKSFPNYEVKITEVIETDYGIPRLHFDVVRIDGKPVKNSTLKSFMHNVLLQEPPYGLPSYAFEGELNILSREIK
jgi:hypothetical protein